jgi:hypothetical protein
MALTKIPGNLIQSGAITAAALDNDAVTTAKILDANITHAKLHTSMDLTGKTVTVATAAGSTNTTAAASTAFVQQELTTLIGGAPGTLDTLNELAAAINDDDDYHTTLTTALATKLPLAGGTVTGNLQSASFSVGTVDSGEALNILDGGHTGHGATNTVSLASFAENVSGNSSGPWLGSMTNENTSVIGSRTASGNIGFQTYDGGWGERMRITSDGKILVGDSSSHTSDLLQIETPASGGGHGIQIRRNDSNTAQGIGHILFGNNTATDLAKIAAGTDGATDSGYLIFATQPTSGNLTDRMMIDSDGNVGIGKTSLATWSSGYKSLQVGGRGFVGAHTGSDLYVGQNASFNSGWKYEASVAASLTQHSGGKITQFVAPAGTAGNAITWNRAIDINPTGEVAVGLTAANGIALKIGNTANNSAVTRVTNGTTFVDLTASSSGKAYLEVGSNHPLILATNATERMSIGSDGKTTFAHNVKISGASSYSAANLAEANNENMALHISPVRASVATGISIGDFGSVSGIQTYNNSTNAALSLVLNPFGGNVGIGTTSPDYQLDIENSGNAVARLHAGASSSASLRLINDAQDWDVNLQTNDKFAIYDHTSGTQPFTIMPTTNNVGIGEITPDDTLHVNNSGGTAKIRIGSGNAAYYTQKGYLGDTWVFGTSETGDNVDFKISGGNFTTANTGGNFRFFTQMSNGTPTERMHISSEGYIEMNSFSAQPDNTDTSTHRKIEIKANGGGQQTHKRDCFVQSNAGTAQYHWYKIVLGSANYGRGSNIKYTANWSTGHASGQGFMDGSFMCRARHDNSRIDVHGHIVYSRQSIGGSYYGWDYDPDITLYESNANGSGAGLYMRVQGSRTSGYDGATVHALYLEIFGSRQDTASQGIFQVGTSTPADVGSAISRTILS